MRSVWRTCVFVSVGTIFIFFYQNFRRPSSVNNRIVIWFVLGTPIHIAFWASTVYRPMGDACIVQMWMGTRVITVVKRLRLRWPGRRNGRSRSMGQGGSRREFVNRPRNPNGAVRSGVRAAEVVSYRGFLIILSLYIISYIVL